MAQSPYTNVVPFFCRSCPRNCECFEQEAIKAELKDYEQTLAAREEKEPAIRRAKAKDILAARNRAQAREEINRVDAPEKLDYLWSAFGEIMSIFQSQNCASVS